LKVLLPIPALGKTIFLLSGLLNSVIGGKLRDTSHSIALTPMAAKADYA
jgi:hypothetical protein